MSDDVLRAIGRLESQGDEQGKQLAAIFTSLNNNSRTLAGVQTELSSIKEQVSDFKRDGCAALPNVLSRITSLETSGIGNSIKLGKLQVTGAAGAFAIVVLAIVLAILYSYGKIRLPPIDIGKSNIASTGEVKGSG